MRPRLRVLCTSTGGAGHVGAIAPVALALRDRGHDVQWAVGADGGDSVGAMGFEWSPAGLTTEARRQSVGDELGRITQLPIAERRGRLFAALFVRAAGPVMQRDLAPIIERVRPDVIVRETAEIAAAPMAAARDIPLVTVAFSGVLPEFARTEVFGHLRPLWDAEGLGEPSWDTAYGQLYLHPFPVSFGQRPASPVVRPMRRPSIGTNTEAPPWTAMLGIERPLVYVSSGTERPSVTFPWRELFASLGRMEVDVVATIGPHVDPTALGTVPSNVRVERFVPQAALLARAAAVVSHGGAGTVLGAASHGLPQLVVPLFADQWENGVAVTDARCGAVLDPGRRSIADFDETIRTLLDDPSYQQAATRVAREIEEMPTAGDLAPEIEAVAAGASRSGAGRDR